MTFVLRNSCKFWRAALMLKPSCLSFWTDSRMLMMCSLVWMKRRNHTTLWMVQITLIATCCFLMKTNSLERAQVGKRSHLLMRVTVQKISYQASQKLFVALELKIRWTFSLMISVGSSFAPIFSLFGNLRLRSKEF